MNNKSIVGKIVRIILCIIFCLFAVIPIYEALIVSMTPYSNLLEAQLVPHYFELSNFTSAFRLIAGNVLNSFFYACCATVLTALISIPAAYVLCFFAGAGVVWNAFWICELATAAVVCIGIKYYWN